MPFSFTTHRTLKGIAEVHKMTCVKDGICKYLKKHISPEYTNNGILFLSIQAEYLWAFAIGLHSYL